MTKEENEQFLQIKNKYKQSWLDDMDVDFLINSIEKLQCENRALKEGNAEAWEEWNNLEQGSYETEQKLKQQIKELQRENEELKERIREHTLLISPYYVKENYIPIQKVKDKIEELEEEKKYYYSQCKIEKLNDKIEVLQELLEEGEKNGKNKR